ncbi:Protein HAPLESS 2-A [Mizuhopecten yessoensis]|uniref:Protein HAPLESS 2-A n=1 Tax=Mizuhopecten yessoensis TaxID=6573 RepID=A0A210QE32_MIZYE|nr:Protein HAPLESS 2-A [Mizuhopecten yessoensis]
MFVKYIDNPTYYPYGETTQTSECYLFNSKNAAFDCFLFQMFHGILLCTLSCLLGCALLLNAGVTTATLGIVQAVIHPCSIKTSQLGDGLEASCQEGIDIILKTSVKAMQKKSQFVTVNEAYSPDDGEDVKLLNPLLIHVRLKNTKLLYPLKYIQRVNNKAYEVFFHKDNTKNYHGCKESSISEMCGKVPGQGSDTNKGFCCSCNGYNSDMSYHIRSGQDCSNINIPFPQGSSPYLSSTHCLRYDSVWYNVYQLKKPSIEYELAVEMYTVDGAGGLTPVTEDSMVVGTSTSTLLSSDGKVSISILNIQHQLRDEDPLGYKRNVILIPEQLEKKLEVEQLPLQLQGNASEFLVLNEDNLALSGGVCDKVGVSFKAFVDQRHRCRKPAQSCLNNQPMEFWLHDIEKQLQRKPTKYFLSGFAKINSTPLLQKSASLFLSLHANGELTANLILQVKVGNTFPARQGKSALITKIIHTREQKMDRLSITVYNPGLLLETYTVSLHSCNTSKVTSKSTQVAVPAHHSTDAVFKLKNLTAHQIITCTVSVSNHLIQNVSERAFWFREGEICICMEKVQCTCQSQGFHSHFSLEIGVYPSAKTRSLLLQGYFSGPDDQRFVVLLVLLVLIILGFVKGLLSLAFPVQVGQCGLCLLLKGTPLYAYYEQELQAFDIAHNEEGTPVHPVTHKPVQLLSRCELVFLNLFFGFYIIFILPHYFLNQCRRHKHQQECQKNVRNNQVNLPEKTERQLDVPPSRSSPKINPKAVTSVMSKSEKELVLEIYKKQKQKLLHHKEVSQSLSKNEMGSYRYDITPPDFDIDESPNRRMTRIKDTQGRQTGSDFFAQKQTLQTLLQTNPVYCNIDRETSVYLKNSGDKYSLCGTLVKEKRKFVFQLGDYTLQTYENVGYPKLLSRPQRIIHPISFTLCLTSVGVHRMITTEPLYPCLNRKT